MPPQESRQGDVQLTLSQFVGVKFGQFLGLNLATPKSIEAQVHAKSLSLSSVHGSRGWWPWFGIESTPGAWQRNEEIHPETVLCNPTLYACVTLIAADISKLGLKLEEQDSDGIWHETESSAFSPFLRKPNHYQTRIEFFEWWTISKLVHGNTYAIKARDGRNAVVAAYILDPCRVRPLVAPDGSVFYQLYDDILNQTTSITVPAREMFHDKWCPLFHPLCGVSPIYAAGFPALQGLHIRRMSDQFFVNGSKPGGVLTAPGHIDLETAARVKAAWEAGFSGDNIGKVAVIGDGLKYEPMAVTNEQAELVKILNMTDEDICKCFHMPRWKVGVGPYPPSTDVEALNIGYYSDCLQSPIEKTELCLDEGLGLTQVDGRNLRTKFEIDDLAKMDTASLIKSEKEAEGLKTVNESRRRLNLPKVVGGDTVYRQQQDFSIEALNRRDSQMPAPTSLTPASQAAIAAPEDDETEKAARVLQFTTGISTKALELARRHATIAEE